MGFLPELSETTKDVIYLVSFSVCSGVMFCKTIFSLYKEWLKDEDAASKQRMKP